jgi:hypothetical protein
MRIPPAEHVDSPETPFFQLWRKNAAPLWSGVRPRRGMERCRDMKRNEKKMKRHETKEQKANIELAGSLMQIWAHQILVNSAAH